MQVEKDIALLNEVWYNVYY